MTQRASRCSRSVCARPTAAGRSSCSSSSAAPRSPSTRSPHARRGERRRILLARALMRRPPLLLLDEPADGLDLPGPEALLAALTSLAGEFAPPAVVLVTHHLEELPPSITHALLLADGRGERLRPRAQRPRRRAPERLLRRARERLARGRPLDRARDPELVATRHRLPARDAEALRRPPEFPYHRCRRSGFEETP